MQGNAEEADRQVIGGACSGFGRGGHHGDDGPHAGQQDGRQHQREEREKRHRAADGGGGLSVIPCAGGAGDGDRGAHGQPHEHDGDHVHDLAAH